MTRITGTNPRAAGLATRQRLDPPTLRQVLGRAHHEPTRIRTPEPGNHGNRPLTR